MRKAQAHSEVFVYIMSIVVVALVLLFGYKAINDLRSKAAEASTLKFKQNLLGEIAKTSTAYGRVVLLDVLVPEQFREVCFVDKKSQCPDHPFIQDYINSVGSGNLDQNIFLLGSETDILYADGIIINSNPTYTTCLCISSSAGHLRARLESVGDGTIVSVP
ncbi:hypothetical protein HZB01_04975 [Candidatus Woesearchaeota archaeon]|nr:hypothetical protein [Candidatus Woesearchaeota archaeon]